MQRICAMGLIALLIANLSNIFLAPLLAVVGAEGALPLAVGPTTAVAGTTINFSAAGFNVGETLTGSVVTPTGQQLALAGVGGAPGVVVVTDAAGSTALVADASGGIYGALLTAANFRPVFAGG